MNSEETANEERAALEAMPLEERERLEQMIISLFNIGKKTIDHAYEWGMNEGIHVDDGEINISIQYLSNTRIAKAE